MRIISLLLSEVWKAFSDCCSSHWNENRDWLPAIGLAAQASVNHSRLSAGLQRAPGWCSPPLLSGAQQKTPSRTSLSFLPQSWPLVCGWNSTDLSTRSRHELGSTRVHPRQWQPQLRTCTFTTSRWGGEFKPTCLGWILTQRLTKRDSKGFIESLWRDSKKNEIRQIYCDGYIWPPTLREDTHLHAKTPGLIQMCFLYSKILKDNVSGAKKNSPCESFSDSVN